MVETRLHQQYRGHFPPLLYLGLVDWDGVKIQVASVDSLAIQSSPLVQGILEVQVPLGYSWEEVVGMTLVAKRSLLEAARSWRADSLLRPSPMHV